jgi:uncharacterized RDD family membrane protein YckC
VAAPDRSNRPGLLGGLVSNVAGAVTPSVVDSIDVNAVLDDVDLDEVIAQVDLDAAIDRVDLDRHLERVDVNRLLDRLDVNRLLDRVDVNALADRLDVDAVVSRTSVADILTAGTTGVAVQWLNEARRLVAAVDTILLRFAGRITRQDPPDPPGPRGLADVARAPGALTGTYAGPVTRLIGYALDAALAVGLYTLAASGLDYVVSLLTGRDTPSVDLPYLPLVVLLLWLLLYYGGSWALTGRTVGMTVVGIRVVNGEGSALATRRAFVRALALPFSFLLFGLGFVGLVVGSRRRGLHDVVADTVVVYDWGDNPAQLPAPLVTFLQRRHVDVDVRTPLPSPHG